MLRYLLVAGLLCAFSVSFATTTYASDTAEPPQATTEQKQNPALEDFLGKWTGKWDEVWYCQFTVTKGAEADSVDVIYEWEEKVGQQPLNRLEGKGKIEGNILKFLMIDLSLSADDASRGKSYGHFKKPRTAQLTRVVQ